MLWLSPKCRFEQAGAQFISGVIPRLALWLLPSKRASENHCLWIIAFKTDLWDAWEHQSLMLFKY